MDWSTLGGWFGKADYKIPVGEWANTIFLWMKVNLAGAFNMLADVLSALIDGFKWLLQTPHPLVIIAIFMAIAWVMQRNWKTVVGVGLGFLFILNQGYWKETTESLTLIVSACAVCMAIGVPIGIACAHRPRLNNALAPVLDLMQTLPTMVYLIPAVVFFGLGMVPGLVATVIFVLPAPIRLTELGISSTPIALKEAATAFGATPSQKLWKVELPWALPQIMVGLNQTIMLSLSMVVIAAMVGANGVGIPVLRALQSMNIAKGFESGMVIVVIAISLRATFQRKV